MALNINGTTGISGVDGSVSAPPLAGTDSNTGISFGSDTIKFATGGVERMSITNSGVSGTGKILQVKQTVKTDAFSFSASATGNVSGGVSGDVSTVSLACSSTSNKVLIRVVLNAAHESDNRIGLVLCADGTQIDGALGAARGNRSRVSASTMPGGSAHTTVMFGHEYLHSPSSTSSITYSYRVMNLDSTDNRVVYVNRSEQDNNSDFTPVTQSVITVMEVAA